MHFEEGKPFLKQWSYEKMKGRQSYIKGCSSSVHTCIFLTRILVLIQGNILSSKQIVTCKQRFPLTTVFILFCFPFVLYFCLCVLFLEAYLQPNIYIYVYTYVYLIFVEFFI